MTATTTIKIYKTRDSAVTLLRKAGVAKADYEHFLVKSRDGFGVELDGNGDPVSQATVELEETEPAITASAALQASAAIATAAAVDDETPPKNNPFAALVKPEKPARASRKAATPAAKHNPKGGKGHKHGKKDGKKDSKKDGKAPAPRGDNPNAGVSDWIRGQILKGKTNAEILDASEKAGFDLTGKKRYFPGWYRFDMAKKGLISK